jgi:nanoRNase/pAp phosphatase (c-di-AMP/oligoRNAs hydrolase)
MELKLKQSILNHSPVPLATAHDKLTDLLIAHRGERHIIILHAYPDPDAISSAYAHRLISTACGVETDIVYCGTISHPRTLR